MGLRGGLHPFVPTNTLPLPMDTAPESRQLLCCALRWVTQLLNELQKPLFISAEGDSLEAEHAVDVTPISATPRRDSLYC